MSTSNFKTVIKKSVTAFNEIQNKISDVNGSVPKVSYPLSDNMIISTDEIISKLNKASVNVNGNISVNPSVEYNNVLKNVVISDNINSLDTEFGYIPISLSATLGVTNSGLIGDSHTINGSNSNYMTSESVTKFMKIPLAQESDIRGLFD